MFMCALLTLFFYGFIEWRCREAPNATSAASPPDRRHCVVWWFFEALRAHEPPCVPNLNQIPNPNSWYQQPNNPTTPTRRESIQFFQFFQFFQFLKKRMKLEFKKTCNYIFSRESITQQERRDKICRTCCGSRADAATRCARRGRGSVFPSAL